MDKRLKKMQGPALMVLLYLLAILPLTAQNELFLRIGNRDAECGDTIRVPVQVAGFAQVVALDFSLTWDASVLEFTGQIGNLNTSVGITPFNFGPYQMPDNDTLTFQWFNGLGISIPDNDTLFTLTFVVRGQGGAVGYLEFGDEYTAIAAGKIVNGNITEVDVVTTDGEMEIVDETAPLLSCPSDTILNLPSGNNQVPISGIDPVFSDNCGVDSVRYFLTGAKIGEGLGSVSGSLFPPGITFVTYRVVDFLGNATECSFSVTVQDSILRLYVIADSTACDNENFVVNITAQNFTNLASLQFGLSWLAADLEFEGLSNFHPSLNLNQGNFGPISGIDDTLTFSWFNPFGVTVPFDAVLFSMTFKVLAAPGSNMPILFGNMPSLPIEASQAQPFPNLPKVITVQVNSALVHVFDHTAPEIVCPDDLTVYLPQTVGSAIVQDIDPNASDNCGVASIDWEVSGATTASGQGSASGTTFNLGESTLRYVVTDLAGNEAECASTITLLEDTLVIIVSVPEVLCTDTVVAVCLTARDFNNLASLQFSLAWDGTVLEFMEVFDSNMALNLAPVNFGPSGGVSDTLTFSWFDPLGVSIPDDSSMFCVRFRIVGSLGSTSHLAIVNYPSLPIEASVAQPAPLFPVIVPVGILNDTIVFVDNEPPVITGCPDNAVLETIPAVCAAIYEWADLEVSDNCTPDVEIVCSHTSGFAFELGVTEVLCIATDDAGLADTCAFTVTVVDNEFPILVCPGNDIIAVSDPDTCGTIVEWDLPIFIDNCDTDMELIGPDTVQFLESGSYAITYSVTDDAGNTTTCSFQVFVIDTTPPVFTDCPDDLTVDATTANCTAVLSPPVPVATDNCGVIADLSVRVDGVFYLPGEEIEFPQGSTAVTWYAFDNLANLDSCVYTLTVEGGGDFMLICPDVLEIVLPAGGDCATEVTWEDPVIDGGCGSFADLIITGSNVSGDTFAIGETVVTYYLIDTIGGDTMAFCSFTIIVSLEGDGAFTLFCPFDIQIELPSGSDCRTEVSWVEPTYLGGCGDQQDLVLVSSHASGDTFDIGETTVSYLLIDTLSGDTLAKCSFLIAISIEGGGSYTLACPSDILIILPNGSDCTREVNWVLPSYSGGCGDQTDLELVGNFSPGDVFSTGTTTVIYHLIDTLSRDTLAVCSFQVTLEDQTPPTFVDCPGTINVVADGQLCGADVNWMAPVAIGNCSPDITYTVSGPSPGFLANGVYTVIYTATDGFGNIALCNITITVCDDEAPAVLSCPDDQLVIIPVDSLTCTWTVDWEEPAFEDFCDGTDLQITASHQPGLFNTGTTQVIYTVIDNCGNEATCSFAIRIQDLIPPVASCPRDVTVTSSGVVVNDPDNFIDSLVVSACRQVRVFYRQPGGSDNCSSVSGVQIDTTGLFSGAEFPAGGPYILRFRISDASGNGDTCEVRVTVLPYTLNITAAPNPACEDDNVQLITETIPGASYAWIGPAGFSANVQNPVITLIGTQEAGSYSVVITVPGCTNTLSGSVNVQVLEPPRLAPDFFEGFNDAPLVNRNIILNDTLLASANFNVTFITQPGSGQLSNNQNGTFTYTPEPGFVGVVEFVYEICYQECPNYCDNSIVRITVRNPDQSCKPNNLITPNNDDRNDVMIFECIREFPPKFPNNSLKVYNQWGDQVFFAAPYLNNWGGTYQGSAGAPLPDGTYYYVFSRGDGSDPVTGFITIFR
jgi:gliding motility-associated-like protein